MEERQDLIDRRAAIDSLHGYFDGMLETDTWSPCDVYGLIELLPSAQPEQVCVATVTLTDEQVKEAVEKAKNAVISVIEPERKRGEWIVWGGMDIPENHGRHKCSECGEFAPVRYEKPLIKENLSNFCPNCGADMRKENES